MTMAQASEARADMHPVLGVVTVTYNSARFLGEFAKCCAAQEFDGYRLYCIDNASADHTPALLREMRHPCWRIELNHTNVGVAAGNNQGILAALRDGCQWVLLLNNDTTFGSDFFRQMMEGCLSQSWRVAVPKIHYDEPSRHIWYAGGGFNRMRGYTGYHVAKGELDSGQRDRMRAVDYAPTCAMLVHRSVFEQVGLMDESYFVYFDDTDFCWRLRNHGIAIGYWPAAAMVHKVGGSTGGERSPFSARLTARNRLYFLQKHFGSWSARLWIPAFLAVYVVRYLLRHWNPACFRESVKGTFSYGAMSPHVPDLLLRKAGQ
jgi:GT2 family glycosyltransferase